MEYRTITFVEKNITFKGVTYNIKALDEESLKQQEEKLINSLMEDFKHVTLIDVEAARGHANDNHIHVSNSTYNEAFGAFLCTIGG